MFNFILKSFTGSFFRTVGRFLAYAVLCICISILMAHLGLLEAIL